MRRLLPALIEPARSWGVDLWREDMDENVGWDFPLLLLPAGMLSGSERRSIGRTLRRLMDDGASERWGTHLLFPKGGETILALRGHEDEHLRVAAQLAPGEVLGFLSFRRFIGRWSEDDEELVPVAKPDEANEVILTYEPQLVFVRPEVRVRGIGHALMQRLGELFSVDLHLCLTLRPSRLCPHYAADYHTSGGGKLGEFLIGQMEVAIDTARDAFSWVTTIEDLEIDAGF